jgi:hypothetical protein
VNYILLNGFVGGCINFPTCLRDLHMDYFIFLFLFTLEEQNLFTVELVYNEQVHSEVIAAVNKRYLLSLQTVAYKYFTVLPESVPSATVSRSKLNGVPWRNFEVFSFLHLIVLYFTFLGSRAHPFQWGDT